MYAHVLAESLPAGSMSAGHLVRLGLLPLTDNCSQWIIGHWTATLGECLPTRNNRSKLQVIQKDLIMICGHDIHFVGQRVLSVFCFVLLYHVPHSLMLYLSLFLIPLDRLIFLKGKKHHQYVMISREKGLKNI